MSCVAPCSGTVAPSTRSWSITSASSGPACSAPPRRKCGRPSWPVPGPHSSPPARPSPSGAGTGRLRLALRMNRVGCRWLRCDTDAASAAVAAEPMEPAPKPATRPWFPAQVYSCEVLSNLPSSGSPAVASSLLLRLAMYVSSSGRAARVLRRRLLIPQDSGRSPLTACSSSMTACCSSAGLHSGDWRAALEVSLQGQDWHLEFFESWHGPAVAQAG